MFSVDPDAHEHHVILEAFPHYTHYVSLGLWVQAHLHHRLH